MADNKRLSLGGRVATPRVPPAMSMEQVLARCIGASIRIQTAAPASRTLTGHVFAVSPGSPAITLTSSAALAQGTVSGGSGSAAASPVPTGPATAASFTVLPISAIHSFTLLELGPHGSGATPSVSGASTPTSPRAATPTSGGGGPNSNSTGRNPATNSKGTTTPRPALPPLPALDPIAAQRRLAETVARLHAEETRRGKGVGPEAQALFDALYRTLPVEWRGQDILVSSAVVVSPPYNPADCRLLASGGNAQALVRVKKVVEMERKKMAAAGNGTKAGTPEPKKGG